MKYPTSFDGRSTPVGESACDVETQRLSTEQARATPSFAKPVLLYDKWRALSDTIPHHNNITPAFIGVDILPEMYIMDVLSGPDNGTDLPWDFRWRLFGTTHRDHYGREATGMLLSEAALRDASAAGSYKVAQQVMKTLEAIFFLTEFVENDMAVKSNSTVVMPLSDNEGNISRLFGCSAWSKF